jgi:hypothetical protein
MSFIDEVIQGIGNLKTLEIRTIIGGYEWNKDTKRIEYQEGKVKMIMSQIDLLGGDITTAFSDDFLSEPYDKIKEFHMGRENRGQVIIDGNIKALKELVKLFVSATQTKKGLPSEE